MHTTFETVIMTDPTLHPFEGGCGAPSYQCLRLRIQASWCNMTLWSGFVGTGSDTLGHNSPPQRGVLLGR